jgi:antitoxin (DNA-binding transcriptional repressor) of toxin-antitoxin stability system
MKSVGVRELKNRLSEYLRQVRAGEAVLVTDRGEVIAEINAPGEVRTDRSVPPGLAALARQDLVTLGAAAEAGIYVPLPRPRRRKRTAAQLLDAERGER